MAEMMERVHKEVYRRCSCDAAQELRWETPQRRMYACSNCCIWWEERKVGVLDELIEEEETFQDTL